MRYTTRWPAFLAAILVACAFPLAAGEQPFLQRLDALAAGDPEACIDEIESMFTPSAPEPGLAVQLRLIQGRAHRKIQQFDEALVAYDRAVVLADTVESIGDRAHAILGKGSVAFSRGDLDAARDHFEEVLLLAEQSGETLVGSKAWQNLGVVLQRQGSLREALDAYTRSMELAAGELQPIQWARRFSNVAMLYNDLGEHATALEHLEQAREQFVKSGRGTTHYSILVNSAIAHRGLGEHDLALRELGDAIEMQLEAGNEKGAAVSLTNMGLTLFARGDFGPATERYDEAIEIQRRLGLTDDLASTLVNKAVALERQARSREAVAAAEEALQFSVRLEMQPEQHQARQALARSLGTLGDPQRALDLLGEAADGDGETRSGVDLQAIARLQSAYALGPASWYRWPLGAVTGIVLLGAMAFAYRRYRGGRRPLLVLCSYCKSVQASEGGWSRLESHLYHKEKMVFSHGICPTCSRDHVH